MPDLRDRIFPQVDAAQMKPIQAGAALNHRATSVGFPAEAGDIPSLITLVIVGIYNVYQYQH